MNKIDTNDIYIYIYLLSQYELTFSLCPNIDRYPEAKYLSYVNTIIQIPPHFLFGLNPPIELNSSMAFIK